MLRTSYELLTIYTDGGARGNPGPAAIGVVIKNDGKTVISFGRKIGTATNNVAEYAALIRALQEARALGCDRIHVVTDSELMARQLNGQYRVKTPHIFDLYRRATVLLAQFKSATVTHVRRDQNKHADRLSNLGADQNQA